MEKQRVFRREKEVNENRVNKKSRETVESDSMTTEISGITSKVVYKYTIEGI